MSAERLPRIVAARVGAGSRLEITWDGGRVAQVDEASLAGPHGFHTLADPEIWRAVTVDEWGHHLAWPGEIELGADRLWLESLTSWGCEDARAFLEWRLRHGLSLAHAAEALGIRPSQVALYSTAAKPVPRQIMLACRGWEALLTAA